MKMSFTSLGIALIMGCCLMLSGCSSEEEVAPIAEGKGAVKLGLSADIGFAAMTKAAVNEDTYLTSHPIANYTVKILNSKGELVPNCEWKYSGIPAGLIELNSGSYKIVAYDGAEFNNAASTRSGIYMYGETPLTINSDQVAKKMVSCSPACGKVVVVFGEN
ncbi:hypothetical protein, secreted, partial [gut metagenome]